MKLIFLKIFLNIPRDNSYGFLLIHIFILTKFLSGIPKKVKLFIDRKHYNKLIQKDFGKMFSFCDLEFLL